MTPTSRPDAAPAAAAKRPSRSRLRSWLLHAAAVALILSPAVLTTKLVRQWGLDFRFVDDYLFIPLLTKAHDHTLTWHDIWAAQMEHRIVLPKLIVLATHRLARGDVRVQNGLALVEMAVVLGLAWRLLLRRSGSTGSWLRWTVPLFLCSAFIFSPTQWMTLLWPICFLSVLPVMFLLAGVTALAGPSPRPWLRLGLAAACAILASLSFAPGLLAWGLLLPLVLRLAWECTGKNRWMLPVVWCAVAGAFAALYFHDLKNEVDPAFALKQGEKETLESDIESLKRDPMLLVPYVTTFSGSFLTRGFPGDHLVLADYAGCVLLLALAAAFVSVVARWKKNPAWRNAVLPWICFGCYTPATGALVGIGRAWIAKTVSPALLVRYAPHQVPLLVSLIAIGAIWIAQKRAKSSGGDSETADSTFPWPRRAGWALSGGLLAVIGFQAAYGAGMMRAWQAARYQEYASLLFRKMTDKPTWLSRVTEDWRIADKGLDEIERLGLRTRKPLPNDRLSNFRIFSKTLDHGLAMIQALEKDPHGNYFSTGYALLPNRKRPADAVLFTVAEANGSQRIFGFTQPDSLPMVLAPQFKRDFDYINKDQGFHSSTLSRWDSDIFLLGPIPEHGRISAWALNSDPDENRVYRIPFSAHALGAPQAPPDSPTVEYLQW